MLRSLKDLQSYKVSAVDGEVGRVTDFLFDDEHFATRYLVTNTSGYWHKPNEVLISPMAFRQVDWSKRLFHVALTQAKVKNSPSVDLAQPISRQYQRDYSQYYGWPYYLGSGAAWTGELGTYPAVLAESSGEEEPKPTEEIYNDPHLQSANAVARYHVQGIDGKLGHITDFLVDDETWMLSCLVIDTSTWWFGKKVLVAPHQVQLVSWCQEMVYLDLTLDQIKNCPQWNPAALLNRAYEKRLYNYYGWPAYWTDLDAKVGSQLPSAQPLPL